jgi:threonine synthase
LPVEDPKQVVYLGEGGTPLLQSRRLGRALGVDELLFKAEGFNPTGSFKARGMATAVSRALELGVEAFVAPSAGNAAGALAAYGAAAGASVTVVMPEDAPLANQREVLVCGGHLILVKGLIGDAGRLADRIAKATGAFDVSTFREPYRVEGKKTMGFELVEDLGWKVPDVVVYPTGGGTGLVAMAKAFDELEALGLIGTERPRLVSVQPEGCAPIVRAFDQGQRFAEVWKGASTSAGGMRVSATLGDFLILDALRKTAGCAVAVTEDAMVDMQRFIGRWAGQYVCLETAGATAAVPELLDRGIIGRRDQVVVFDTATGHKSVPPVGLPLPPSVDPDAVELDEILSASSRLKDTSLEPSRRVSHRPNGARRS